MQLLAEALRTTLPLLLAGQSPIANPGEPVEAINQLHLDDEGRIWIRPFEHPGHGPRVWQVFAEGTSRVCTAMLPPRTRILDIRGQHLLALVRSPDGVEEVRLYAFVAGSQG